MEESELARLAILTLIGAIFFFPSLYRLYRSITQRGRGPIRPIALANQGFAPIHIQPKLRWNTPIVDIELGMGRWQRHLTDDLSLHHPFDKGDGQSIRSLYRRFDPNRTLLVLEYAYLRGGSRGDTYEFCDVVVVEWGHFFPYLSIRRERTLDQLKKVVGVQDIQFEEVFFNERFLVQSSDTKFAYDFFHPKMMERMMREFHAPFVLTEDRVIFVFDHNQAAENIARVERMIDNIEELLPNYVRKDHGWAFKEGQSRLTAAADESLAGYTGRT